MNVEQLLRAAAAEADWPATPDLARRWQVRRPHRRGRRSLTLALAILLIASATAAAVPGIREPVLDWLGLRSVHIERVPRPLPQGPGARLGLGDHTTLAAARKRLGFSPVVPTGLGAATVYYEGFPPGGRLSLVYRDGRMLLTQVEGELQRQFFQKFLLPGTKVEPVGINGERGLWIHGPMHQYAYSDRTGQVDTDSVRTAGDVLLWRRGDLLLRLEGARSKREALRIARSAHAAP